MEKNNTVRKDRQEEIGSCKGAEVNEFKVVSALIAADAMTYLEEWIPGGKVTNGEYVCGSIEGGPGSSFNVNLATGKFIDHADDQEVRGGDYIALYAKRFELGMGKALQELKTRLGLGGLSPEEYQERMQEARERALQKQIETSSEVEKARARCRQDSLRFYREGVEASPEVGYLRHKDIQPVGEVRIPDPSLRLHQVRYLAEAMGQDPDEAVREYLRSTLLMVPVLDIQGHLHGLQYISMVKDSDGNWTSRKKFHMDTVVKGHFFPLFPDLDGSELYLRYQLASPNCLRDLALEHEKEQEELRQQAIDEGWIDEYEPTAFNPSTYPQLTEVLVCEGYATGASLFMATNLPTLVAFNAGNIEPVVAAIREVNPELKITICADYDVPSMTGQKAAEHAAALHGCRVVCPDNYGRKMDYNDVHIQYGLEEVRKRVVEEPGYWPKCLEESVTEDSHQTRATIAEHPDRKETRSSARPPQKAIIDDEGNEHEVHEKFMTLDEAPFACVGVSNERSGKRFSELYHFTRLTDGRHLSFSARELGSRNHLLSLADGCFWHQRFHSPVKKRLLLDEAVDKLIQSCIAAGQVQDDRFRREGIWMDAGRVVLHTGDALYCDGKKVHAGNFSTEFIYLMDSPLGTAADALAQPLTLEEVRPMLDMYDFFEYKNRQEMLFVAGFATMAPFCGLLPWRPHLHITGGSQAGKSTLLQVVKKTVGGWAKGLSGDITEAGIRQTLTESSRPVLYDESEPNSEEGKNRMPKILGLVRIATQDDGSVTVRGSQSGTAQEFKVKSMFCFSSIITAQQKQADRNRFCFVELRGRTQQEVAAHAPAYEAFKLRTEELLTPEFTARLRARTLALLPVILDNIVVFRQVMTRTLCSARLGDLYAPLLAGAYSLHSDERVTAEQAEAFISPYQWLEVNEEEETRDENHCLALILQSRIRYMWSQETVEMTIAGAISQAMNPQTWETEVKIIRTTLQMYGVDVLPHKGEIRIATSHREIKRMLYHSDYHNEWANVLARIPGASRSQGKSALKHSFQGHASRFVAIPTTVICGTFHVAPQSADLEGAELEPGVKTVAAEMGMDI